MRILASPLLVKELRLRMRERKAFWLPALFLALVALLFLLSYAEAIQRSTPWFLGEQLFAMLGVTYFALVLLLVPALSAGSVTTEKERRTLSLLVLTGLRPHGIVFGKIHGAAAYALLLVSLAVPFHVMAFLLGGVAWQLLVKYYVSLVAAAWLLAALGVRLSVYFRRSIYATAANYAFIGLFFVLPVVARVAIESMSAEHRLVLDEMLALFNPFCVTSPTCGRAGPLLWLFALALGAGLAHGAAVQLEQRAAED